MTRKNTRTIPQAWYEPNALGIVSYQEMPHMFCLTQQAVYRWQSRRQLPEPDVPAEEFSGKPVWRVETMVRWGAETGRPTFVNPRWLAKHAPDLLVDQHRGAA